MSEIEIYENGNVKLRATVTNKSVWYSQEQINNLFGVQRLAIAKHGALKDKKQTKKVKFYNLNAILSVGYTPNQNRLQSQKIDEIKSFYTKSWMLFQWCDEQSLEEVA